MDDSLVFNFEKLKISAFTKLDKIQQDGNNDIHKVTLGPNSIIKVVKTPPRVQSSSPPPLLSSSSNNNKIAAAVNVKIPSITTIRPHYHSHYYDELLNNLEVQRQGRVSDAVQSHCTKFATFSQDVAERSRTDWLIKQREFVADAHRRELDIVALLLQDGQHQQSNDNDNQLAQNYHDLIERKLKLQRQFFADKERQRVLNGHIEHVKRIQVEFRAVYQDIITVIKGCTNNEELRQRIGEVFRQLKSLPEGMETVIGKCRNAHVDENDIKLADAILMQVRLFRDKIVDSVRDINNNNNNAAAAADVVVVGQEAAAAATTTTTIIKTPPTNHNSQPVIVVPTVIPTTITNITKSNNQSGELANLKYFFSLKQYVDKYSESFHDLIVSSDNNKAIKQFITDCKHAVNFTVNSLLKIDDFNDKYSKLYGLLSGQNVAIVGGRQVNATSHVQGIAFCTDLLARKFTLQGLLMSSGNQHTAFIYAKTIASLWLDFPDFGQLILGYFFLSCPCLVPINIHSQGNDNNNKLTDLDVYLKQAYDFSKGKLNVEAELIKGIAELMRIYFAILIAKPVRAAVNNDQMKRGKAWTWLIDLIRLEPRPQITAIALYSFFATIGYQMDVTYGRMFRQLVDAITRQFMPILRANDQSGSVARLDNLLADYRKDGGFRKPIGVLPPD